MSPALDASSDSVRASMQEAERLIRSGRISNGLAMIQQCCAAIEDGGTPALLADCKQILGLAFQYSGDLRESLLACFQARELYERSGSHIGVARTLSITAVSLARIGDSTQALDLLRQSHTLARTLQDPGTEFRVWINMSVVYETLGDYLKAIPAAETAIEISERAASNMQMTLHARTKLYIYRVKHALACETSGAHDKARELLAPLLDAIAQHCQACRDAGFDHMVTSSLSSVALVHLALGAPELSRSVLEEGLALAVAKGLGRDQTRILLTLGEAEHAAGEATRSSDRLQAALKLAQQLGEPELVGQAYLQLSRTLEARGDHAGALAHFRRYHESRLGTVQNNAATRAQVLAIQLDSERARVDAEVLRLRATELENDKRNLMWQAEELSRRANEDPLTGLGNRRYFSACLEQMRTGSPDNTPAIVLAIADIDHFKHVNDRFSHAVGDQVLCQVGQLFRQHCRPQDVVARFGGEEFVLALVDTTAESAKRIVDRLRQRIADHDWSAIHPALLVTISIGLAVCVSGSESEALSRADAALYVAKNNGRNQIQMG